MKPSDQVKISFFPRVQKEIGFLGIFSLVSVFALFAYGIDAGSHHTYNLYYHHIFSNPEKFLDTPIQLILKSQGARLFTVHLDTLLLNSSVVIVLSVLNNIALLSIAYFIAKIFLGAKNAIALTIVIGLVAHSPLMGWHNSELVFTRKTMTLLLILISFLLYFQKRLIVAGLFTAGALFLHPIDALSAFYFFIPGFALYLGYKNPKSFGLFLLGLLPSLAVLISTYNSSQSIEQNGIDVSLIDWYRFSLMLEADDVSMLWKFRDTGIFLAPLLLSSFCFAIVDVFYRNNKYRDLLSLICLSHAFLISSALVLEFSQINGLNLGLVSEIFSSLQLRRGIWVPMLFALVICYRYLSTTTKNTQTIWILALIVPTILDHSPLVILTFLFIALFLVRQKAIVISFLLSIGTLLWCSSINAITLISVQQLSHLLFFMSLAIIFFFISTAKGNQWALVITLLIHSCIILANNNLRHDVLLSSYDYLVHPEHSFSEGAQSELEILEKLNALEHDSGGTLLFAPSALGYKAPLLSNHPILFSRWDNTLIFNRDLYGLFIEKVRDVGVSTSKCSEVGPSNIDCILSAASQRIDNMTFAEVISLKDKYNINFVVRRNPLPGAPYIFSNKEYFIYKI